MRFALRKMICRTGRSTHPTIAKAHLKRLSDQTGLGAGGILQGPHELHELLGQPQRGQIGINDKLPIIAESEMDREPQFPHGILDLVQQRMATGQIVDGTRIARTELNQFGSTRPLPSVAYSKRSDGSATKTKW